MGGWGGGLKQGSDHHYRGAIVLWLSRPFLMRAPQGGGQVGTETGRWVVVVVGGVKVCRGPMGYDYHPPSPTKPKANLLVDRSGQQV